MTISSITTVDLGSSTATGQGGQSIITGTPTPNSFATFVLRNISAPNDANSFYATISGTWTGTISIECSGDGGATHTNYDAMLIGVNSVISSFTSNCLLKGNCAQLTSIRFRATSVITGTATINFSVGLGTDVQHIELDASGISIGGVSIIQGSNTATVDSNGNLHVVVSDSASSGTSTYSAQGGTSNALLTSTAVTVKNSAAKLYGIDFVNNGSSVAYVQIFDALIANITLGTTAPKMAKWVPAGGAWEEKFCAGGEILFATGIALAATTTPTGNTAPSTGINANVTYI